MAAALLEVARTEAVDADSSEAFSLSHDINATRSDSPRSRSAPRPPSFDDDLLSPDRRKTAGPCRVLSSGVAPAEYASAPSRVAVLDSLRAVAAQLIVWHHLAFYGPLSDTAMMLVPGLIVFLFDYGRMAVQVFLVVSGFLAAQGMLRKPPETWRMAGRQLAKRFGRLAQPYWAVLLISVAANAVASRWMDHPAIAAPPSWSQLLAHALLMQDLLNYEPLLAGIWYLAVDWQMTIFVVLVTAACWRRQSTKKKIPPNWLVHAQWVFAPVAVLSLFWWNRDPQHDQWAGYYFGSYYLGMLTAWCMAGMLPRWLLAGYAAVMIVAITVDWRLRLAVSMGVAALLLAARGERHLPRWLQQPWLAYAAKISYSLFLIHFPVCLLFNTGLGDATENRPWLAAGAMVMAYVVSLAAAVVFHHTVETADWRPRWSFLRTLHKPSVAA